MKPIRGAAVAVVALVSALAVWSVPLGASVDQAVVCLDSRLRPSDRCPAIPVEVAVTTSGDDLRIEVTNAGAGTWTGGPVAAELPVPEAKVTGPTGEVGVGGVSSWVTRAGVVVARCTFEPVDEIKAGRSVACRLPRLGLADGTHTIWLTGFVGGLAEVGKTLGDDPVAVGVVPVAESRSVIVEVQGREVSVVAAAPDPDLSSVPPPSGRGSRHPIPWVVTGLLIATTVGVLARKRRRRNAAA